MRFVALDMGKILATAADLRRELETLKKEYVTAYAEHHHRRVLDIQGDERRRKLYDDPRLAALKELSGVDLLRASGGTELTVWQQTISGIQTCRDFHEGILAEISDLPMRFPAGQ